MVKQKRPSAQKNFSFIFSYLKSYTFRLIKEDYLCSKKNKTRATLILQREGIK